MSSVFVEETPDDVIWSMQSLREANPFYNAYYKNITKAEQTGDQDKGHSNPAHQRKNQGHAGIMGTRRRSPGIQRDVITLSPTNKPKPQKEQWQT